jgi:hypothetical protein
MLMCSFPTLLTNKNAFPHRHSNRIPLLYRLLVILAVPVVFLAIESSLALAKVVDAIAHRDTARKLEDVSHRVSIALHAFQSESIATAMWIRQCNGLSF